MADAARRIASYEDLLALPEDVHAEIIDGEIVVAPSPTPAHQYSAFALTAGLDGPFHRGHGGPGGWWFLLDVDVAFGAGAVLRPDVSGWRRERVPRLPSTRPVTETPDWICEVLSTSTAHRDLGTKRATYQAAGVPWYWVVDLEHRELIVYRLTEAGYVLDATASDDAPARLPPFDAIELHLADALPPRDA